MLVKKLGVNALLPMICILRFIRLRMTAKSARHGKSVERLLPSTRKSV